MGIFNSKLFNYQRVPQDEGLPWISTWFHQRGPAEFSTRSSTPGHFSSHREGTWLMPAVVGQNGFQRIMFEKVQPDWMQSSIQGKKIYQLTHGLQLESKFYYTTILYSYTIPIMDPITTLFADWIRYMWMALLNSAHRCCQMVTSLGGAETAVDVIEVIDLPKNLDGYLTTWVSYSSFKTSSYSSSILFQSADPDAKRQRLGSLDPKLVTCPQHVMLLHG